MSKDLIDHAHQLSSIDGETFFRGTLEKLPSEGLPNCPRSIELSSNPPLFPFSTPKVNRGKLNSLFSTVATSLTRGPNFTLSQHTRCASLVLRKDEILQGDLAGRRLHFVNFVWVVLMSALFCLGSWQNWHGM